MDQAGPSYAPSDPLPGTFFGLSLNIKSEKLYELAPDIPDVRLCGARCGRGPLRTIDHMRRIHKVPLSVKAANLARFFPPWTVTREQWADIMMPSISGVAIDTLCHRYRIISRTGSHTAFRGTYLCRLRAFLEESDSAVVRRLHRQLAQELAAWISLPTDSPASVPPRSAVGHQTVSRSRRPRRLK